MDESRFSEFRSRQARLRLECDQQTQLSALKTINASLRSLIVDTATQQAFRETFGREIRPADYLELGLLDRDLIPPKDPQELDAVGELREPDPESSFADRLGKLRKFANHLPPAMVEQFLERLAKEALPDSSREKLEEYKGRLREQFNQDRENSDRERDGSDREAHRQLSQMLKESLASPLARRTVGEVARSQAEVTGGLPKEAPACTRNNPEPPFPKRASWLRDKLRERSWNKHDLARQGGPDHKTVQKVLNGFPVREDVLQRIADALSKRTSAVTVLHIPQD